jgi:hypothetical protein
MIWERVKYNLDTQILRVIHFSPQSAGGHNAVASRRVPGYTSDHGRIYAEIVDTGTQISAGYKRERDTLETT